MKTQGKRISIVIACSLALCALPSASAGPDADKHFKMMDTNGDGQISSEEHAAGVKTMFANMDTDKDGFVTAAEMDAYSSKMWKDKDDKMAASDAKAGKDMKTGEMKAEHGHMM